MDKKKIEKLVWAGTLAPSADNCQPFLFESKDEMLLVYISYQRAKAFLDWNKIMSWLSLGCVLTNIKIMAQSMGYSLDTKLFPEHGNPQVEEKELVAIIKFKRAPVYNSPLLPYLDKRCTNRHSSPKYVMPDEDLDALLHSIGEKAHVQMDILHGQKEIKLLTKQITRFYPLLLEHQDLHHCLYSWLRWNQEEVESTRDGFIIHALEMSAMVKGLLRLSRSWGFSRLLCMFNLHKMVGSIFRRRYKHASAFALFSITDNKREAYVKAGQQMERLWLEASRLGYSIHPSIGTISLALRVRLENGKGMTASQIKMIKKMEHKISDVFIAFTDRLPVSLLRLSKTSPPSTRTMRLPVSEVLTYSEG